ncbi:hypothetical protein [Streptomyces sp. NPDC086766]|uniref:hypothetical protein n=1 Tax=Streptomyces sp. NPDC086766 TaxID=3365754 RepID=UPI00380E6030
MRARIRKSLGLAVAALAMLGTSLAAAPSASAAPHTDRFAAQARAAHLTDAQSASLRSEVDRILVKTGGKQVALNEIDLNGQGRVMVAIPGETHPRDFVSAAGAVYSDPCLEGPVYSGYFCAYSQPTFQGSEIQMYYCQSYSMPWGGYGSWVNDQTAGTRARFYGSGGSLLYTTPGAYSSNQNYYWTPVWTIRPC